MDVRSSAAFCPRDDLFVHPAHQQTQAPEVPFTRFVRGIADSLTAHIYVFAHILKAPPKSFFEHSSWAIKAIIAEIT